MGMGHYLRSFDIDLKRGEMRITLNGKMHVSAKLYRSFSKNSQIGSEISVNLMHKE
jgi:hypothetical protein